MTDERKYFRTNTKEIVDGLIENFRLNLLPANGAVRDDFGIVGVDGKDEKLFDALMWAWNTLKWDRDKLLELQGNGPKLTEAVNVEGNPFAPVTYETTWDLIRADQQRRRAEIEGPAAAKDEEE